MATNNHTTEDSSVSLLRDVYTNSLAPLTSVISLGERLVDEQYINNDIVDRIVELEGENGIGLTEAKKLLVTNLMTLGPAKVGEIKRILREFVKSNQDVIKTLGVKVPPSMLPAEGRGIVNERSEIATKRHSMTSEMETFSILFHTFLYKFITSYEKSSTIQSRLPWLLIDTPIRNLPKYFHSKLNGSKSHVNVSMETLLEAFRQLRKACIEGEQRQEREKQKSSEKDFEELQKLLTQKDLEIKEMFSVNEQWMLECQELKEKIMKLENNQEEDYEGEELCLSSSFSNEGRQQEEGEDSELNERYTEALGRIEELERQLNDSVRQEDYQLFLDEKRDNNEKILHLTKEKEILTKQLSELQSQDTLLKDNNDKLINDIERLREESEEDKNHIEELKDQVSNLRLNLKSKEPSVREMSILLETNRKLAEELNTLKTSHQKEQLITSEHYQTLEKQMREERERLGREKKEEKEKLEKENIELQKSLNTVKDELLAVRTYLQDVQQQKSHTKYSTYKTTPMPHPSDPSTNGRDQLMSFTSQQRQCPICSRVYPEMSDKDFQLHVARCFQ